MTLRYTKNLKNLGFNVDATYSCISTINTMLYNADTNIFGHATQTNDRRGRIVTSLVSIRVQLSELQIKD